MIYTNDHLQRRVQYTPRSGDVRFGSIREVAGNFVDVEIDGMRPRKFFCPMDMVQLLSEDHPEYKKE